MPRGGARNRSGPRPDPKSGRSERRGYQLDRLPAAGYDGDVPEFPLPSASDRELAVWAEVWRSPQACAWSLPQQSWMVRTVAVWVRTSVRCEDPEAPATLLAQLHRFADQIGMTTAGLQAMGWVIVPELEAVPDAPTEPEAGEDEPAPRRLSSVP